MLDDQANMPSHCSLHQTTAFGMQVLENHKKLLERKQKELADFKTTFKIQVKGAGDEIQQQNVEGKGLLVS
jgi:two-component sensor histidine kinase